MAGFPDLLPLLVLTGALVGLTTGTARATVAACRLESAGDFYLNYCSNHGMYPRALDTRYRHLAPVMAQVRSQLVKRSELRPLPVLVEVPFHMGSMEPAAELELSDACEPSGGDSDVAGPALGPCYRVTLRSFPDYAELLGVTAALARLLDPGDALTVRSLQPLMLRSQPLRQSWAQQPFFFDDARASRGDATVRVRWLDGATAPMLTVAKATGALPAVAGELVVPPRWSARGWLAYASDLEVVAHDFARDVTHRMSVARPDQVVSDVKLAFDRAGTALEISCDYDHTFSYEARWRLDLVTGKVEESPRP